MSKLYELLKEEAKLQGDILRPNDGEQAKLDQIYELRLKEDLINKRDFLEKAKYALSQTKNGGEHRIEDRTRGYGLTNMKIPFNPQRGDTIGIAMAYAKIERQLEQSTEVVNRYKRMESELDTQISNKESLIGDLQYFNKIIRRRIHQLEDSETDSEEDMDDVTKLEAEIDEAKIRHRKLKRYNSEIENGYFTNFQTQEL